ncbi:MAG TPA: hypothetical protein GX513_08045, partial [Firmicutes bacterium]|nr:hypothetical protein [Bacillota bacterium]
MLDIHTELGKVLAAGEKVALATVVETRGPTPRLPGTRMAIRRNGQHLGTVGGGCGEAEVIRAGLLALDEGRPRWVRADLTEEVTLESETSCGGTMDFLVVPWGRELLPVVEAVAGAVVSRQRVNLVTVLQPIPGAMLVWGDNDSAWAGLSGEQADALSQPMALPAEVSDQARKVTVDIQGQPWSLLWEVVRPAPCLLIAGGGHIAVPLSQMGRLLGFEVVVL